MPEGIPFSLTQGDTPTLADLTVGGKTSGIQQGLSLYWTLAQIVGVNHSTSPVTPIGGALTETLGEAFSIDPIAAAGGTTRATGTLLARTTTVFVSVNPDGVCVLPTSIPGMFRKVLNDGLHVLTIWPAVNDSIGDYGLDIPVSIVPGGRVEFTCNLAGNWRSA